jgi:hypothetical protein
MSFNNPGINKKKLIMFLGIMLMFIVSSIITSPLTLRNVIHAQLPSNDNADTSMTDRSPSFLEAYWIDNTQSSSSSSNSVNKNNNNLLKKEVGPAEGASTLAVVLVNRGRSDITGITGHLTLPSGFESIEGENLVTLSNVSVASYNSIVKPGESFTLYFIVNVLKNANVGAYSGSLHLMYSKVLETGQLETIIQVPFRITGKVVLDALSMNKSLVAGSSNELKLLLKNDGTADANGVIVTVKDITEGTTTTTPTSSLSSSNSSSTYTNETSGITEQPSSSLSQQQQNNSSSIVNVQAKTFNIGTIPSESSVIINPVVYPSYSSGGTVQNLGLDIVYNDAYGNERSSDTSVGLVIAPNPPETVLSISPTRIDDGYDIISSSDTTTNENIKSVPRSSSENNNKINEQQFNQTISSLSLTAGQIENVTLFVTNNGNVQLRNLVLSLNSQLDSVKILGKSKWTFQSLDPLSSRQLSTMIYSGESVIGNPVQLNLDADYISRGQAKTDSLKMGLYVDGQIKVRMYDLEINYIGNVPNLVGNLLNEGNTVALFTNVAIVNNNSGNVQQERIPQLIAQLPPAQYLGDLSENSPLPFSIPLDINRNITKGMYPISVQVAYKDSLRNIHSLLLNGTIDYSPQQTESSNEPQGFLGLGTQTIFVFSSFLIIGLFALVFVFIRKRKKRKLKNHDSDLNNFTNGDGKDFDLFDK